MKEILLNDKSDFKELLKNQRLLRFWIDIAERWNVLTEKIENEIRNRRNQVSHD